MDWEKYAFVIASEYRKKIVKALDSGPKTPKQVSLEAGLHITHTSSTLNELVVRQIVVSLTPNLRKGKLYQLTELGIEISKMVH